MTKEFRESLERLKHAADANVHLASEMAELLELREAVRRTEEAAAARLRGRPRVRVSNSIKKSWRR
jgi:DNA-binding protein H-NS